MNAKDGPQAEAIDVARARTRRRFQAAVRVGRRIGYLRVCESRAERDEAVREAKQKLAEGRDPGFRGVWDGGDIDDPWLPPSRHPTGERRLCAAMLLQAARDLGADAPHLRSGARGWVLSESVAFGSFRFCCDTIARDVMDTRRRMLNLGDDGLAAGRLPLTARERAPARGTVVSKRGDGRR